MAHQCHNDALSPYSPALDRSAVIRPSPHLPRMQIVTLTHTHTHTHTHTEQMYWLARMLEGGEDPLFIGRRLLRAASEDVGLADPFALPQA